MNELAPFQNRVIQDVDTYGISILCVTDAICPFFYSIGARANGLPDAIVCGNLPKSSCKYLQIVWPDKQGAFPWDESYDPDFIQPTFIKPLKHAM